MTSTDDYDASALRRYVAFSTTAKPGGGYRTRVKHVLAYTASDALVQARLVLLEVTSLEPWRKEKHGDWLPDTVRTL